MKFKTIFNFVSFVTILSSISACVPKPDPDNNFSILYPDKSLIGLKLSPVDSVPPIDEAVNSNNWCISLDADGVLGIDVYYDDGTYNYYNLSWEQVDDNTIIVQYIGDIDIWNVDSSIWMISKSNEEYKLIECP